MNIVYTQLSLFDNCRICRKCQRLYPKDCFYANASGYVHKDCKACERKAALASYYTNRDSALVRMAEWRRANPDRVKANWADWYKNNKGYQKRRFAAYRIVHRDYLLKLRRSWYLSNHRYVLEYRRTHRGDERRYTHNRRALKRANGGRFTLQEWQGLCLYYEYQCLCCGKQEPEIKLTIDHVIPLSKGGRNDISNLQPLCHSCNSSKKDREIDYRT